MSIQAGDRVRVKDGCMSASPGEIFMVKKIKKAPNPYTFNGGRRVPDPAKPDWYATGDRDSRGVWGQFLELVPDVPSTDWEAVTAAASERAGYDADTWRTAQDVVQAAIETERESYEVSARHLRDALDDGTDLDKVLRLADRLLDDLGITEGWAS